MSVQAFDFSVDLLQCLLWQFNNAPRLQSILESKQAWYDAEQEGFWNNWIRDVFDLTTANEFGLSVWARILGVPLVVPPSAQVAKPVFGFGAARVGFTLGDFAAGASASYLTLEQRRLVLRLRYFQLITRGAVTEVNAFLSDVFGPGAVYVEDSPGGMAAVYVFTTPPTSAVELVLSQFDLLPRPAGVKTSYVVSGQTRGFGFGSYHLTFTNGNFSP